MKDTGIVSTNYDEIMVALAPIVADPSSACVFLDLDGTLAPIVSNPQDVAVPAPILKLVRKLERDYLAVCIVTGRPATEAKRIMGISELAYIGNHGFETMLPGRAMLVSEEAQPYVPKIRDLVEYCRTLEELTELGIMIEDKVATMSIHFRRAPDPVTAKAFIMEKILPQAGEIGLAMSEGRMVFEARPPVALNKGVSVGRMLDLLGASRAVYMGDDTTDVDALRELRDRKARDGSVMVGIGVYSQEMPPELPAFADMIVSKNSGVEMVLQVLAGELEL